MPPDEDERLIEHFGDLTRQWQLHRETINRAIGLLATEIFDQAKQADRQLGDIRSAIDRQIADVRTRLDADDRDRAARQQTLDAALANLRDELRSVRRWQWLRVVIEIMAVVIALALYAGARWL